MEQKKLFTPESWEKLSKSIDLAISKGIPYELEVQTLRDDGTIGWMWTRAEIEKSKNGEIIVLHGVAQDITERKEQEEKLKQSEKDIAILLDQKTAMFNNHDAMMLIIDPDSGEIADCNLAAIQFYGYSREELLSKKIFDINTYSEQEINKFMDNARLGNSNYFTFTHKLKNGKTREVDVYSSPIPFSKANKIVLFSIIYDVTEREKAKRELEHYYIHDDFTGLYNRSYLMKVLHNLDIDKYSNLGVILFDINNLKLLNSNFGSTVGDEALLMAAKTIKQYMLDDYMVFRYGEDEFVVLIKDIDEDSIRSLARDIALDFAGQYISDVSMTLSYGVSVKDILNKNIVKIIDEAEIDLYRFKTVHMNSSNFTTLKMLLGFLTEKFDYEKRHSEFVGIMSERVGEKLSLGEFDINELGIAGMFHDIGKLTIPDKILNKPGGLTDEEYKIIKKHPVVGYEIIRDALPYSKLCEYILYHHERIDGKGYPKGLKGEEIPLISRILCVVDAYEAMTSERIYQKGMSKKEAIIELRRCKGTQFDAKIAETFISIISNVEEGKVNE